MWIHTPFHALLTAPFLQKSSSLVPSGRSTASQILISTCFEVMEGGWVSFWTIVKGLRQLDESIDLAGDNKTLLTCSSLRDQGYIQCWESCIQSCNNLEQQRHPWLHPWSGQGRAGSSFWIRVQREEGGRGRSRRSIRYAGCGAHVCLGCFSTFGPPHRTPPHTDDGLSPGCLLFGQVHGSTCPISFL